jgi:hypothetical protein
VLKSRALETDFLSFSETNLRNRWKAQVNKKSLNLRLVKFDSGLI